MLSPKVQRMQQLAAGVSGHRGGIGGGTVRINDGQLLGLAEKARYDSRRAGYLHKRCSDSSKWLQRWFRLYQVITSTLSALRL